MDERQEKRGGSGVAIGCGLMLLLGLPLYVLWIGPVDLLVEGNASLQWVGIIYYPLGLLAEYCHPIDDALTSSKTGIDVVPELHRWLIV